MKTRVQEVKPLFDLCPKSVTLICTVQHLHQSCLAHKDMFGLWWAFVSLLDDLYVSSVIWGIFTCSRALSWGKMAVPAVSLPDSKDYCIWVIGKTPISVELQHDKTNTITCAPSEDSDQCIWLVFAVHSVGSQGFKTSLGRQQRLIRLSKCPGWSEFSLDARHFVGFVVLRLSWYQCWMRLYIIH